MLDTRIRDDCWNLWVREGSRCLGHNGWLITITVGFPKVPFQLLHRPGELVRGYRHKVEDVTFQVTELALEVGHGFGIWTLGFGSNILTSVLLGLGCFPIVFISRVL